jgi:membrane protease subunit HflK
MQYDNPNQGPDVGDVVAEVTEVFSRNLKRFGPALFLILVVLVAAMGIYKVDPGGQGVVRRFGKEHRRAGPGLHYAIPLVESVDVVNVEEIRRIEVGFRADRILLPESLMLTGDENMVEVRMVVQFRVSDPGKFLFRIAGPEDALHSSAEVAIRTVVGQAKIDDVMTTGRAGVQATTRILLQRLMDEYSSGIEVTEVKLDNVDAPDEVKDAFNAVTRAREEKEKLVNQARGYAEDKVPRARGEARTIEREAEGYKEQRVLRAVGDVANFVAVLEEYEKAKDVTRRRLYLETMERILAGVPNKVLVDEKFANSALPILPIGATSRAAVAAGVVAGPAVGGAQ